MRRLTVVWLLVVLGFTTLTPGTSAPVAAAARACFAETTFCAENAFLVYWQTHGATEILGLPVSQAVRDERGLIVQYYERAILEWHPENSNNPKYQVLLTRLGAERLGNRPESATPANACGDGCAYFAETQHTLRGLFLNYWTVNGGLPVFGLPLTEEFAEVNPADGQVYVVQYFERNRFEYHPEQANPRYQVLLGLLGVEALRTQPLLSTLPAVTVPDYTIGPAGVPVRLTIPALGVDAAVEQVGVDADGNMDVPRNPYNTAWYTLGARPGQLGNAAIAGHIDYRGLGQVVFARLAELAPGMEVWITDDSGVQWRFVVQRTEIYPVNQAPLEQVFGPSSDVNLNLISCIGTFDSGSRSYDQRVVVYTRWDGMPR